MKEMLVTLVMVTAMTTSNAQNEYIKDATQELGPRLTLVGIKAYYGSRLKESDFACKLPENAALRPPKGMDCHRWSVPKVLFGGSSLAMDTVVYGATSEGLVTSAFFTKVGDCTVAMRDFFTLQSFFFEDGKARASGFEFGPDLLVSKGTLRMDGQLNKPLGQKYLELEYSKGKCELTYSYEYKS